MAYVLPMAGGGGPGKGPLERDEEPAGVKPVPTSRKRKAAGSQAPQDVGLGRLAARKTGRFSVTWSGRPWEFGFVTLQNRKKQLGFPALEPSDEDVKVALAASVESGPAARLLDNDGDVVYSYHHRLAGVVGTCALIPLSLFIRLVEHFGGPTVQSPGGPNVRDSAVESFLTPSSGCGVLLLVFRGKEGYYVETCIPFVTSTG